MLDILSMERESSNSKHKTKYCSHYEAELTESGEEGFLARQQHLRFEGSIAAHQVGAFQKQTEWLFFLKTMLGTLCLYYLREVFLGVKCIDTAEVVVGKFRSFNDES